MGGPLIILSGKRYSQNKGTDDCIVLIYHKNTVSYTVVSFYNF